MSQFVPTARQQVLQFKVNELQECCRRLGLNKTGKKAILQDRILVYIGEEPEDPAVAAAYSFVTVKEQYRLEAALNAIRSIYAATYPGVFPATTANRTTAPISPISAPSPNAYRPPTNQPKRVRCICNAAMDRGDTLQCQSCGVWQHGTCMGLPRPYSPQKPANYHCEQCRVVLADPFWEPLEAAIIPAYKLNTVVGRAPVVDQYGCHPIQAADRAFYLSGPHVEDARKNPNTTRLTLCCLQLNDEVPFRLHWPRNVDLRINQMAYRPYSRNTSTKMGINQRDAAASIATLSIASRNTVSITAADSGSFVMMVQRVRNRGLQGVTSMMTLPETKEQAVQRVKRLVGGDAADDDGVVVTHHVVSLKDPMSGQRIQKAARFTDASGLQAFDLDSFLSMAERNRKWQDPTTLRNSTVKQLQADVYMQHVLQCTAAHPNITDIEIDSDGLWRPEGCDGSWWSISQPPSEVVLAQNRPRAAAAPTSRAAARDVVESEGVVIDSEEETDEEEELRRAAAAVRSSSQGALAKLGDKRKREEEIEVIDLVSSDDEGPGPAARAAPAPAGRRVPMAISLAHAAANGRPTNNPSNLPAAGAVHNTTTTAYGTALPTAVRLRLPAGYNNNPATSPAALLQRQQQQQPQQLFTMPQQQRPGVMMRSSQEGVNSSGIGSNMPSQQQHQVANGRSAHILSQEAQRELEEVRQLLHDNPDIDNEVEDWLN